jgi:transposase
MKQKKRRSFTREYKLDVIQQSYVCGNISELADRLGINVELNYRWLSAYENEGETSFPRRGVERMSE